MNKIQITLEVNDKGSVSVKQFGDNAKRATQDASDGFSKLQANVVAFNQALETAKKIWAALQKYFEMSLQGETLKKQEIAFNNLAKSAGASAQRILADMKNLSKGMVTEADLIRSAGTSMMLGIPADKLASLMRIAEATSRQTGQSVTEAFGDITLAVGRGSKMILDNLGIIVDVGKANEEYAKQLSKTVDSLTDAERKQAFLNATLKAGDELVNKLGDSQNNLQTSNKILAESKNLWNEIAIIIAEDINKSLGGLPELIEAARRKLKQWRDESYVINKKGEYEALRQQEAYGRNIGRPDLVEDAQRKREALDKKYLSSQLGLGRSEEFKKIGTITPPWGGYAGWKNREGQYADLTAEEKEELLRKQAEQRRQYKEERDKQIAEQKKLNEEEKKLAEERLKIINDFQKQAMALIKESPEESEAARYGYYWGGSDKRKAEEYKKEREQADKEWEEKSTERALYYARLRREQQEEELQKQQELHRKFSESLSQNVLDPLMDFVAGTQSFRDTMQQVLASLLKDLQRFIFELANTGGKSGGSGLFGTLFSLAGPVINAYVGGSSSSWNAGQAGVSTGMTTNTFAGGFSGRASGGPVSPGQTYIVGEHGPEILQMGSDRGIIIPNHKLGGNNINIYVNVDGSKGGTSEQNQKLGRQIAKEVREEVKKILSDERRYGGILGAQSARAY